MATVAKMSVTEKIEYSGKEYPPEHFEEGHWFQKRTTADSTRTANVKARSSPTASNPRASFSKPVYSQELGSENHLFWMATPNGELRLQIENQAVARYFDVGADYYVEIRKGSIVAQTRENPANKYEALSEKINYSIPL